MKLRATEAPNATPTPTPPRPTAAATASTRASIVAVSVACSMTVLPPVTVLASMCAFARVRMTLVAWAPAPEMATATLPAAIAREAAAVHATIVAFSVAEIEIAPVVVSPVAPESACEMYASTSLAIVFQASAMPIAPETDAVPPIEAAIEAAPVSAWIAEMS